MKLLIWGTTYHDPSLPENAITWQYCVVPVGYNMPDIQHELLYEVYIPAKDENTGLKSSATAKQLLLALEHESVKLTGNLPENENGLKSTSGLLPDEWTPKGTIKVWDDAIGSTTTYTQVFDHWEYYDCSTGDPKLPPQAAKVQPMMIQPIDQCQRAVYRSESTTVNGSYIPLVQATVHARWFTHIESDLTDNNGYFETSKFNYEVNYAIKWERADFDIRDGNLLQAWYNGPKQKGDWNLNIRGGESVMFATMHRAAYKSFYGDNLNLYRPSLHNGGRTKICYIDNVGTGCFWGDWSINGILPDIRIFGKNQSAYKPTNQVFGATIHELAHQAHSQYLGNIQYWQVSKIIYESWADAVEWGLSNDEYHKLGIIYNDIVAQDYDHAFNNRTDWPIITGDIAYSPIFIDLVDNINQRFVYHFGDTHYPNDIITGYSLENINKNILTNSYGISSLKSSVKNNIIAGVTDAAIDELFSLY